jgi:methylmalonyl-CoA mutase
MNFYLEIAKMRAARLLWWRIMNEFNRRTRSPDAAHPLPDLGLVADRAGSLQQRGAHHHRGHGGGVRRHAELHTNSLDEAIALPTEFSSRIARNTQLIIQEETHITNVVDPWAGSYMMEKLTQDIADEAWRIIEEVDKMGGMTQAVQSGWAKLQIEKRGREAGTHRLRQGRDRRRQQVQAGEGAGADRHPRRGQPCRARRPDRALKQIRATATATPCRRRWPP